MNSFSNLVPLLACLATGITFFLGFFPIARVTPAFFALHSLIAGILWLLVFLATQNSIFLILVGAVAMAWHNFRLGKAPNGKMFLALSSGLAVGFGLFRNAAILPPPELPPSWNNIWVLSTLFSAAVLGSCYLFAVAASDFMRNGSIDREMALRSLRIFLTALALRALLFLGIACSVWLQKEGSEPYQLWFQHWFDYSKLAPLVMGRFVAGLLIPGLIGIWGLSLLKQGKSSFKLAPFYMVVFLVIWGESLSLKLGF